MNELQKELFVKFTHFLGEMLGPKYEVVFHIITKEGSHIAAIANGHISGRTINSPLTAFASKLIQEKTYLQQDFLCGYKAIAKNNKTLNGSTFFIKEGDELVGIFCINRDTSEIRKAINKIIETEGLNDMSLANSNSTQSLNIETLSQSIEDILAESIDLNFLQSGFTLTTQQKQDCIANLYNKGIFNIKGAISIIASLLKMSEPSVYRYLQKLKPKD